MEQHPSLELTVVQLVKKFTTFYETWRLSTTFTSTTFTSVRHLPLSWVVGWIPSTPSDHNFFWSMVILSPNLRLRLLSK
jgi:hypothetical protein